jgi:hypothetical protein
VNRRSTRSCTGGPGLRLEPRLRAWLLKIRSCVHNRFTRFREGVAGEVGGRTAQDLVLLLQLSGPRARLAVLRLQIATLCRAGPVDPAVLAAGDPHPPVQARLGDPEAPSHLRDQLITLTGDRDHVAAELRRIRGRHDADPSSEDPVLTDKEWQLNLGQTRTRSCRRRPDALEDLERSPAPTTCRACSPRVLTARAQQ